MLSKLEIFSVMLAQCEQEVFTFAYLVWMDEGTKKG